MLQHWFVEDEWRRLNRGRAGEAEISREEALLHSMAEYGRMTDPAGRPLRVSRMGRIIGGIGETFLAMGPRERGSILSSETAAGLLAGSGVKIISILQGLGQLKKDYRDNWETFIGNAGVSIFFGNADTTTLSYISDKLGKRSLLLRRRAMTSQQSLNAGAPSQQEERTSEALLTASEAEQVLRRENNSALVLMTGEQPVLLKRITYYKNEGADAMFYERWVQRA